MIIVRCAIDLIHGYMCAFLGGTSINHIFVVCKKIAIFDRILFLLWLAKILLPSSSFTKNPARVRVALQQKNNPKLGVPSFQPMMPCVLDLLCSIFIAMPLEKDYINIKEGKYLTIVLVVLTSM